MDSGVAVVIGMVVLAVVAVVAIVLRGQMSGDAEGFGLRFKLGAGRRQDERPGAGQAIIDGSETTDGGAEAIGPGGALIKKTRAKRDLSARADGSGSADPKA
jgi:hypothetical protein